MFKYVHCNPAVSLVCFVIMVQTGGLLAGVLLGVPPIEVFTVNGDIPTVGSAASVWFLMFFCPFDLFYRVCCLSWTKVSCRWSIVYPILVSMHLQDTTAIFFPLSRITAGVVWGGPVEGVSSVSVCEASLPLSPFISCSWK